MRLSPPLLTALTLPLALMACEETPASTQHGVGFGSYSAYQQRQQTPAPTVIVQTTSMATAATPAPINPAMASAPTTAMSSPAAPLVAGGTTITTINGIPTYRASYPDTRAGQVTSYEQVSERLNRMGNDGFALTRRDQHVPFAVPGMKGDLKRVDLDGYQFGVVMGVNLDSIWILSVSRLLPSITVEVARQTGCAVGNPLGQEGVAQIRRFSYGSSIDLIIVPVTCGS